MLPTAIIYHPHFLDHDTSVGHQERPDRLRNLVAHLKEQNLWDGFQHLQFNYCTEEDVLLVHTKRHFDFVKRSCLLGEELLDEGDTHICKESFDVAMLATGGVLAAIDVVLNGNAKNAFCAVRPPGHHAESDRPMGFCLFNNVAIGARYAQKKYGLERVAILDWDVHHGNGTQEIFYEDPSVLYISAHQFPLYPGMGARNELVSSQFDNVV